MEENCSAVIVVPPVQPSRRSTWNGYVIDYVGKLIQLEIESTSEQTDDIPFLDEEPPGPGVWIWEGVLFAPCDDSEARELSGAWRRLTALELRRFSKGDRVLQPEEKAR